MLSLFSKLLDLSPFIRYRLQTVQRPAAWGISRRGSLFTEMLDVSHAVHCSSSNSSFPCEGIVVRRRKQIYWWLRWYFGNSVKHQTKALSLSCEFDLCFFLTKSSCECFGNVFNLVNFLHVRAELFAVLSIHRTLGFLWKLMKFHNTRFATAIIAYYDS